MQFCLGDEVELNVNLFSLQGFLDINYFQWGNMVRSAVPEYDNLEYTFASRNNKDIIDFDLTRYPEPEIAKNFWKDLEQLDDGEEVLMKIKNIFEPQFVLKEIFFDDVGFLLFKIVLVAAIEEKMHNKVLGVDVLVQNAKENVRNEIKKNCIIFDSSRQLSLRVGDILVFYFVRSK